MNINANEDPNITDYNKVPVAALRQPARALLSKSLNPFKVLLSEDGIQRDWRGVAYLAGLDSLSGRFITAESDPMAKVLSLWCTEGDNQAANFDHLLQFLQKIDRWDVVADLNEILIEDTAAFNFKQCQDQPLAAGKKTSQLSNNSHTNLCGNVDPDENILTVDDVKRSQIGLPPQSYDAFLLFADEDFDFAKEIINKMEDHHVQFGFKLCVKDRDLLGGIPLEHAAILRLIIERCNRLIVIVSPAFLKSAENAFFINFAAALQIGQRRRKIIPCLYKPCQVPPNLSCFYYLKYFERGKFFNFWDKLSISIRNTNVSSNGNGNREIILPRWRLLEELTEPNQQEPLFLGDAVPELPNVTLEPRLRIALTMSEFSPRVVNNNYPSENDLPLKENSHPNLSEIFNYNHVKPLLTLPKKKLKNWIFKRKKTRKRNSTTE